MDNSAPSTSKTSDADQTQEASTSSSMKEKPEWELARYGMVLVLNNKPEEAKALFQSYPDSLVMYAGYAFVTFMDALLTMDEEKLTLAFSLLKETEKKCNTESTSTRTLKVNTKEVCSMSRLLESQIILADCQACLAALLFLHQDISGFFKGGWVLRKSWRVYVRTYEDIMQLYNKALSGFKDMELEMDDPTTHPEQQQGEDNQQSSQTSSRSLSLSISSILEHPRTSSNLPYLAERYTSPLNVNGKLSHSLSDNFGNQGSFNAINKCPYVSADRDNSDSNSSSIESVNNHNIDSDDGNRHNSSDYVSESKKEKPVSFPKKLKNGFRNFEKKPSHMKKSATVNGTFSKSEKGFFNGFLTPLSIFASNLSYITSAFGFFSTNDDLREIEELQTVARLLCGVSFGYGLFNLGISFLPPSLMRITAIFGITGSRAKGLDALMTSRLGTDMRSPLATLSLLWFHTVIRPYYALDPNKTKEGVNMAWTLLKENEEEFAESALFLFYKGKTLVLKTDIPTAVETFTLSVQNAAQTEIKRMSLHEIAWCYLMQQNYEEAEKKFHILHVHTRWALMLYVYLETICAVYERPPNENQMGGLLMRRFRNMPRRVRDIQTKSTLYWKMLIYEMLYLWNSLPSCCPETLKNVLTDCQLVDDDPNNEPMLGLSKLIQGFCYCITKATRLAEAKFREGIEQRKDLPINADDAHISAFLFYELGLLLVHKSETRDEGRKILLSTRQYKQYDFEGRVTVRVNMILKQISEENGKQK